jgi:membrane protein implicated in regulation of membrane protease activity
VDRHLLPAARLVELPRLKGNSFVLAYIIVGSFGLVMMAVTLFFDDILDGILDLDNAFLSGSAIGGFAAAFGFGGALALSAGTSAPVSAAAGVAAGLLVGGVAGLVTRSLTKAPTALTPSMNNIVGCTGSVTATISPGSLGEVSVTVGSHTNRYNARSDFPLEIGTRIEVVSALSATSVMVRETI